MHAEAPLFERRDGWVVLGSFLLFVVLVSARLSGWSLPIWLNYAGGDEKQVEIWGKAQGVRADDWALDIPMAVAQSRVTSEEGGRFPLVNPLIGEGQYMGAPINVPVAGWMWLFRPFAWGYAFGPDVGLAWKWWGLLLGLFVSAYLLARLLLGAQGGFLLPLLAALQLLVSPYFQFWSFHKVEILIHALQAVLAWKFLLRAASRTQQFCCGLLLAYSWVGMALDIVYPPIAVSLGWWMLAMMLALAWQRLLRDERGLTVLRSWWPMMFVPLLLAALALVMFSVEGRHYLSLLWNTEYPGRRSSVGGDLPWSALLGGNLWLSLVDPHGSWMGNISESGAFFFSAPLIFACVLGRVWRRPLHAQARALLLCMGIFASVSLLYACVGLPAWLAKLSLWSMSTSNRVMMGLGMAEFVLVLAFLRFENTHARRHRWLLALGALLLLALGWKLRLQWPQLPLPHLFLATVLGVLLWALLLLWRRPRLYFGVLLVLNAGSTLRFNPMSRAPYQALQNSPLAEALRRADVEGALPGKPSTWVALGESMQGNFFRLLGLRSIDGYHGHPHFSLWHAIDPARLHEKFYNRAAFVEVYASANEQLSFDVSRSPGILDVRLPRDFAPTLRQLGVTHVLAVEPGDIARLRADTQVKFFECVPSRVWFRDDLKERCLFKL